MTGCHESRSAMDGKEICLTGLLPHVGQESVSFMRRLLVVRLERCFLTSGCRRLGEITVLLDSPPRELLTTKTLWKNDGSRSQHQRS